MAETTVMQVGPNKDIQSALIIVFDGSLSPYVYITGGS